MNHHVNPGKLAITLGAFVGGLHVVWSLLVGIGWAQGIINFVFWAHMMSLPVVVKKFELSAAVTLIIVTTIVGYVVGYVFAHIWNRMHRE